MLTESAVRKLYESCKLTVELAMGEVTIDAIVVEAEQQARAYASVLGEKYAPPKRNRQ